MVGRPALQLVSRTFDCNAISLPRCTGSPVPRPGFFLLGDRLAVWARTSQYASLRTRKLANDAPAPRGLAMRALGAPTYLMPDPPRPCLRRGTRPNKNARSCRALCCASSQWPPKRYRSWHGEQNVASDHPGCGRCARNHNERVVREDSEYRPRRPGSERSRLVGCSQVNKVCGYSGLRSRASNSFKPASGVISPCNTARTALEIGSSMPWCSA